MLIGATLFAASELWSPSEPERPAVQREPIVITAEQISVMEEDFLQRWGRVATPQQLSALITQTLEEEMLYREARVLALDFQDGSVDRRLVEKMRVVSDRPGRSPDELIREARALGLDDDIVIRRLLIEKMRILLARDPSAPALTDADLEDYLHRHRERFLQPAELTFSHIFLDRNVHGADLENAARVTFNRVHTMSPANCHRIIGSIPARTAVSGPFPTAYHGAVRRRVRRANLRSRARRLVGAHRLALWIAPGAGRGKARAAPAGTGCGQNTAAGGRRVGACDATPGGRVWLACGSATRFASRGETICPRLAPNRLIGHEARLLEPHPGAGPVYGAVVCGCCINRRRSSAGPGASGNPGVAERHAGRTVAIPRVAGRWCSAAGHSPARVHPTFRSG